MVFVCLLFSFRPLFPLQCAINCCIYADCAWQKYKPPTFILVSTESCGRLLSKYGQNMGQRPYGNKL